MKLIGIDVGGTFTDVVVLDEDTGATSWFKALTDPEHPAAGIMNAFSAAGIPGSQVAQLKLGTTLSLNALLTRSGAKTGLLTTEGFRDVLEIRRTHRQSLFDLYETVPEPLVPRYLRMGIAERVAADGSIVRELDEEGVRAAWRKLRSEGVTSVAICFLFSFVNDGHEVRARELIEQEGGAEAIYISSEVLPVYREYERTSTTVTAAYVAPVVRGYIEDLSQKLAEQGVDPHRLSVMTNSGGLMSSNAAARSPIPTLLSGPAGGVRAATWLALEIGSTDLLTLDMGGTSCDVSGIQGGIPDERLDMSIEGLDVAYPTYDIHTIGSGGGSIAWVDTGGALRVGPHSAGSSPGPACYALGGTEPTVTDANLILGRYDTDTPLGGSLRLDAAAAREAVEKVIATPLGISVEAAAAGILRIVNAHMINAVKTISVERGRDTRDFALAAFGGAGPVHATDIAVDLSIPTVLIPPFPGCNSAFGAVIATPRRDAMRSLNQLVVDIEVSDLQATVDGLSDLVAGELTAEGHALSDIRLGLWFNIHYKGQAHDLVVPSTSLKLPAESLGTAVDRFHAAHQQAYGHAFDDVPVELVTVRLTGVIEERPTKLWWDWGSVATTANERSRPVYFPSLDDFVETRILSRASLEPSSEVRGPAIVQQTDTTIVVPPGYVARTHENGSLVIDSGLRFNTEGAR